MAISTCCLTPRHPLEPGSGRLLDLARDRKQRRIDDQGLRLARRLGEDFPPQGSQVAPQIPHPPVERGRVQPPRHPREQVREEPPGVAQERAFGLDPPEAAGKSASAMTSESESRLRDS